MATGGAFTRKRFSGNGFLEIPKNSTSLLRAQRVLDRHKPNDRLTVARQDPLFARLSKFYEIVKSRCSVGD